MDERPNHIKCAVCNRVLLPDADPVCDVCSGRNGLAHGGPLSAADFRMSTPEERQAMREENARLTVLQGQQQEALRRAIAENHQSNLSPEYQPAKPVKPKE